MKGSKETDKKGRKCTVQEQEGPPIIEMLPDAKLTFQQFTDWYMGPESVQLKESAWRDGTGLKFSKEPMCRLGRSGIESIIAFFLF
jgi:hypothetical protein